MQLLAESAKAYADSRSHLDLEPADRSLANACGQHKGTPKGEPFKDPGYFGEWSSRFRWQERAWDAHIESMSAITNIELLQAARRHTVEQTEKLQALIDEKLNQLQNQRGSKWRPGGDGQPDGAVR